jgi:spermidine/putrescine transport system substrate-binding protein
VRASRQRREWALQEKRVDKGHGSTSPVARSLPARQRWLAATSRSFTRPKQQTTLKVLAWPGYDEKPVVGEFEEANKIKVEFKNYIGGEQMLQYFGRSREAPSTRSSATPSTFRNSSRRTRSIPLDASMFKNLADYHPKYQDFPLLRAPGGKTWGIATRFSCYGISYNKKYVSPRRSTPGRCCSRPSTRARS